MKQNYWSVLGVSPYMPWFSMPAGRLADWMRSDPWSFSSIELHTFPKLKYQLDQLEIFSIPNCFKKSLTPTSDPDCISFVQTPCRLAFYRCFVSLWQLNGVVMLPCLGGSQADFAFAFVPTYAMPGVQNPFCLMPYWAIEPLCKTTSVG